MRPLRPSTVVLWGFVATLGFSAAGWLFGKRTDATSSSGIPPDDHLHRTFKPLNPWVSDFALFRQLLERGHSGLYVHRSHAQMDSLFAVHRAALTNETTELTFYRSVATIMSFVGSLHDEADLPESLKDSLYKQTAYFPYPVKLLNNRVLVNTNQSPLPLGAELLSINGHPLPDIVRSMQVYYTTDGINLTGKRVGIESQFAWYYRLVYGPAPTFVIRYQLHRGGPRSICSLPAVPMSVYRTRRSHRYTIRRDTTGQDRYAFHLHRNGRNQLTGLLTINSFEFGETGTPTFRRYHRFLDSCFTRLVNRHVPRLIVDIRKNGGGDDPNDLLTFSYIAKKPFRENRFAYTLFQRVPLPDYMVTDKPHGIADLETELRTEHNQYRQGRYYQNSRLNPIWQPNKHRYRGQVSVLIGPAVASAASLFAGLVKSQNAGTLIGEETMGGYYGHTGHISITYKLPYSGLLIHFSIVTLRQDVEVRADSPVSRGIMPDVYIDPTRADFVSQRDAVLDWALSLRN